MIISRITIWIPIERFKTLFPFSLSLSLSLSRSSSFSLFFYNTNHSFYFLRSKRYPSERFYEREREVRMSCTHDHSCEEHNCSSDWSLYKHIDLSKASALNESVPGSVKSVFKAWEQRLETSGDCLESNDDDPELLVFIPFTSDVKIKSISVVGGAEGTSPSKMRAFINHEGIDFSDAQNMQAVQEWELAENLQGVLEYQTKYSKFQSVANLTLHFPANFGGDTTRIYFIGLRGEATQLKRDVVATIVYEVMPNPSDHKTKSEASGGSSPVE
ncbi:PITH domain-containing protein 1 [Rhynchospora pubera]|uniref:PITH domain-containing protein 1 n=1 Tax=Rhynchospora pubera TaxID=906938 RepID=A0AAV8C321_9POAL|nr:PITH domain-containing protein 1 [Rhynchospora pubera]